MSIEFINAALVQAVWLLTPEMILAGFACLVFLGGTFVANRNLWGWVAFIGFGAALFDALQSSSGPVAPNLFAVPIVVDSLAQFTRYVAILSGIVLLLLSWHELGDRQAADHHACLLVLTAGLSLVGSANDLTTMFLALELISIPTYIMLYLPRHDDAAQEAALKYFVLSVFSSAMLLFGFSYLFGITGSTNISVILHTLNQHVLQSDFPATSAIALVTIVCGLAFRITAVPFHFYAPDVYQGVANVNAALLAYVPKVAGVVALLRVLGFVLPDSVIAPARTIGVGLSDQVPLLLWILAAITMFVGNLLALRQEHIRRILAYSSIAHAGYMLAALSAAPYLRRSPDSPDGVEAVLYYLIAYGAMTVGVFAILSYLDGDDRRIDTLDDVAGLSTDHPALAICLAIFLFSLIGIPFTAGFTGKFFILFGTLALQEPHATLYRVLALIIVVNAAIGGWYYLRIVAALYLRSPLKPFPIVQRLPAVATITICMVLTIGLSIPPGLTWMQQVIKLAAKNPPDDLRANRN
jgi:NADH-quinone oxidoreductase subunit N